MVGKIENLLGGLMCLSNSWEGPFKSKRLPQEAIIYVKIRKDTGREKGESLNFR